MLLIIFNHMQIFPLHLAVSNIVHTQAQGHTYYTWTCACAWGWYIEKKAALRSYKTVV